MNDARGGRGGQGRVGTAVGGEWRIDARIGSGGMATVYAASHLGDGTRVAIKMLHATLSRDPSTQNRFLREGYVANSVQHPGVPRVLDRGIAEDGSAYLVIELLEGETIDARRVRMGGMLPIEEVLDIADQTLEVLQAAHERGIVHRDVKPENIFLTTDGHVKLLDFGLARMKDIQVEATQTGVTIGTPEFMPPEQARGRRDAVDARSDIWGLGATVFTAITGRYVHDDAQSLHEQLVASATRRSRPIRQLAPHVSPPVASVLDRALELEMADRWQSAFEMRRALLNAREAVLSTGSMTMQVPMVLQDGQYGPPASVRPEHTPRMAQHASSRGESSSKVPPRPTPRMAKTAPRNYPSGGYEEEMPRSRRSMPAPAPLSARAARRASAERRERSSARFVIMLSLVLIVVCAAMAAYVFWRGSGLPPE